MDLTKRYITILLLFLCSICAFSQSEKGPLVIHIPYGDTISQELIDSIYRQEGPYILSYHPKMAHLIPEMRCRLERIPAPCREIEVNGVTFNMMCVEGERYDYLIGQTEVTCAQWKAVMGSLPKGSSVGNKPVCNVTWGECLAFITKLNELTGLYFRFPTVDEWRYAAKGGQHKDDFIYSGSDNIDKVGWYNGNAVGGTQEVAQLKPNSLGVYDMTGNVWEWAEQLSNGNYPYLGGSYAFSAESCLLSKSKGLASANHTGSIGLRLVLDVHEYVDLGLSVKWATYNVGATAAEENGNYYAWGETEPKDYYDWSRYKWCDGTKSVMTKYNKEDGLTTLLPEDDAAHVNWGGEWRMPTKDELTELRERCVWELTTLNGVKVCKVTGPNSNSIFLPLGGSYNTFDDQLNSVGQHGWIYSSTRSSADNQAQEMSISASGGVQTSCSRCVGLNVRAVLPIYQNPLPEYVDMGLSVKWATCNLGASHFTATGDFYAWGETEPKDAYTVNNYKWYKGSAKAITRYCTVDTLGNEGFTDGLTELKPEDDAAYMQKGGKWRMPSDAEWDELRRQCTWTLVERHGVSGYDVKSKINGNTIFIPVVGFRSGDKIVLEHIGGYWSRTLNEMKQTCALGLYINKDENRVGRYSNSSRHNGFLIRPVYDENKVTVTVNATQNTARIGFLCIGYTRVGNTITVDKGKSVLWSVTNDRYLSQSDSLLNLTKDTTLNVTLAPFTEGNWVALDTSEFEHVVDYYISRNRGAVAGKYVGWSYYILPVEEGETYRVTTKGGQLAAPWLVVSSLPDPETKIRATKVACSDLKGPATVVSEEFTIPSGGGKWLIINASRDGRELVLEKYLPYRYGLGQQQWDECNGRWGHGGRGHAPTDQSVIQGTYVHGVRLKVAVAGSLNVYKVPSLQETTEENFELVATLTTDKLGLQNIDFPEPIYVGENEYLVFGKPSEPMPTLVPLYNTRNYGYVVQNFCHFVGADKERKCGSALMVDFY